jgi:hypothetical protein
MGRNRQFEDRLSTRNRTCFSSADFWHTTGIKPASAAATASLNLENHRRFARSSVTSALGKHSAQRHRHRSHSPNPNHRNGPQRRTRNPARIAPERARLWFGIERPQPPTPREFASFSGSILGSEREVSGLVAWVAEGERFELPLWFGGKSRNQDANLHADFFSTSAAPNRTTEMADRDKRGNQPK